MALRAVTFLELLARPAPARVVAPDLLPLVDPPLLDRRRKLLLGVSLRCAPRSGGHRHRAGCHPATTGVGDVSVSARRRARARARTPRRRGGRNALARI